MTRRRTSRLAALLVTPMLAMGACTAGPRPPSRPAPAGEASLRALYERAVREAAVIDGAHEFPLVVPEPDADGTIRVAHFTGWTGFYEAHARPDRMLHSTRDLWVSLATELRDSCAHHSGDARLALLQRLGLPPGDNRDSVVILHVRPEQLFRPAADPRIDSASPCRDRQEGEVCGTRFPAAADTAHRRRIAEAAMYNRQLPGGFPWTGLGYTYNWRPGSPRYGVSEYVVRAPVDVRVEEMYGVDEFCSSGGG